MSLAPIAPGYSPVFTATVNPSNGTLVIPPTWTTTDSTNAPVSVDSTGLIATINIPTTAVIGTIFELTINYTNPASAGGGLATAGVSLTIVEDPGSPVAVTGFAITQTA